ncbi:MAG: hypothetical protein J7K72_03525 [Candidatus Aenigmarchaeota archaeon]|nr:hypothetical protein [Candidatus Aenigmarchaeota archaeon]
MKAYLYFSEIKKLKVKDLVEKLNSIKPKKLSDLSIKDLIFLENGKPICPGHGVYIFYDLSKKDGRIAYVGRCESRSFIERIPSHFDIREDAWMNQLITKYREKKVNDTIPLHKIAKEVLDKYGVVLILFDSETPRECIRKLEGLLRRECKPYLNPCKPKDSNQDRTVDELVCAPLN